MCWYFPRRSDLLGKTCKWTQEQYAVQSSLVMLCFYFLCVTVRLSFCELKFLYERQGTVTAQTTLLLLDCLHLFFYLFMIINKGKENQVPSNCVLISHCQNHNQRTWMCSTIFFGGGSLFNSKGEKRVRQSIIHLFSWLTSNYSQLIQNDSLSLNITKCHERNKKTRPTGKYILFCWTYCNVFYVDIYC